MNSNYKEKLKILRERIPVGVLHGLRLFDKTNGDIEQAEIVFQEETINLIIDKTGIDQETAKKYLTKLKFDISATLTSIDEERYSISERILIKYKDKETALKTIASIVEENQKLTRDFWLQFDGLENLNKASFCLLTILEWLDYTSWEGFDYAIYFHLDTIIEQIETQLLIPQVADTLRQAKELHQKQYEEQQRIFKKNGALEQTPEFAKLNKIHDTQRQLLIDTLYNYTKKHIKKLL